MEIMEEEVVVLYLNKISCGFLVTMISTKRNSRSQKTLNSGLE